MFPTATLANSVATYDFPFHCRLLVLHISLILRTVTCGHLQSLACLVTNIT
jgi:hypothetical protein